MTLGLLSLGTAADLWSTAFTGFALRSHKQIVPILGDGTTVTGNSVLQQSAQGFREATIKFTAPDRAQMLVIRGYEESSQTVAFIDADGSTRDVRVLDASYTLLFADVWEITAVLQELSAPVGP